MAIIKYVHGQVPTANVKYYLSIELSRVEASIGSMVTVLNAISVPIEIGPADSGGAGYRVLRIPN